jgi:hypothetical protein
MSEFRLSDWPVKVRIMSETQAGMFKSNDWYGKIWPDYSEWCNQTYGWGNWEYYYGQFLFKREEDATLFRLRWS